MLIEQIKRHEGFSGTPYKCSRDKWTIGYGRCIETNPLSEIELAFFGGGRDFNKQPMTEIEADYLLANDLSMITIKLETNITSWHKLNDARRAVLVNMAFNVGVAGLFSFKNMISAVNDGYFNLAAKEMFDSKWRTDIGQERFTELVLQMATGNFFNMAEL